MNDNIGSAIINYILSVYAFFRWTIHFSISYGARITATIKHYLSKCSSIKLLARTERIIILRSNIYFANISYEQSQRASFEHCYRIVGLGLDSWSFTRRLRIFPRFKKSPTANIFFESGFLQRKWTFSWLYNFWCNCIKVKISYFWDILSVNECSRKFIEIFHRTSLQQ